MTTRSALGRAHLEPYDESRRLEHGRTRRQGTSSANATPTGRLPANDNQEGLRP